MAIVAGSIGIHAKFVQQGQAKKTQTVQCKGLHHIDILNLNLTLTPQLVELLNASISINSTTFEDVDSESGAMKFIGSKTETALLKFAKDLGWANYKNIHDAANVVLMIPFSSECNSMGCVVRLPDGDHLFMKGASEILTWKTHYVINPDH